MVQDMTIIMVEHRLKELFCIANRVMVNFGQKIAEDAPQEAMSQPNVRGAYLGSELED